ncbi:hypothetical protein ASZ90_012019 [hydrocarbon metagenome]|uniref:Uncharacterized protein n=1 Tax=hydrocarbon metagenome TaxID=938273 RepID=A0A0W8FBR3_9ZZZZ
MIFSYHLCNNIKYPFIPLKNSSNWQSAIEHCPHNAAWLEAGAVCQLWCR